MARLFDLCAFLAAFTAVTLGVGATLPAGGDLSRGEVKFERYRELAGEADVVFLGSSRTFRGFDPALFDSECERLGLTTASYNFGVHGAFGLDIVHFLERLVAHYERTGDGPSWVRLSGFQPPNVGESH